VIRDGREAGDPVFEVGVKDYVIFSHLPAGCGVHGDGDVEVREVTDVSEGVKGKPISKNKKSPPKISKKVREQMMLEKDEEPL